MYWRGGAVTVRQLAGKDHFWVQGHIRVADPTFSDDNMADRTVIQRAVERDAAMKDSTFFSETCFLHPY